MVYLYFDQRALEGPSWSWDCWAGYRYAAVYSTRGSTWTLRLPSLADEGGGGCGGFRFKFKDKDESLLKYFIYFPRQQQKNVLGNIIPA